MKRWLTALLTCLALALWGAGTAAAEDPPSAQDAGQAAESGQAAGAGSGATQSQPSNQNISVRVLSPGDDGDVTQSNTVSSDASATNANATGQTADQTQSGAGIQAAGQGASSLQLAAAYSSASQSGASNTNIPVRVLSPGSGGDVTQSNSVESHAAAANANVTAQDVDQSQSGDGCPCPGTGGIQTSDQSASNEQAALAKSEAEQKGAENKNISVRVLSPGDDGDVTQSNDVSSSAKAVNLNATKQSVDQDQSGGDGTCCPSGPSVQTAEQDAESKQAAGAFSSAEQQGASNTNIPVRVLSPGGGGDVTQSNSVSSSATAANLNLTKQEADQDQAGSAGKCCPSGPSIQVAKQDADSKQAAVAASAAVQVQDKGKDKCGCPSGGNTNAPVRVHSPGGDGDVTQTNSVASTATAANLNLTKQDADQSQGGSGSGIQTVEQDADSEQAALAGSLAIQLGASNSNVPVRVHSPGGGGDVTQSNDVSSSGKAVNLNLTKQEADQDQAGSAGKCCPSGPSIQVAKQDADSKQAAVAASAAVQVQDKGKDKCGCPSGGNTNAPVRVHSPGGDGDVTQTNTVASTATAANLNLTKQDADQDQGGSSSACCPSGPAIQTIGQDADSKQAALAKSAAIQKGASNTNAPVRVKSPGGDGDVTQTNSVSSTAAAVNANLTGQSAEQDQAGGGIAIQALGQSATSHQLAGAASAALQLGASNRNGPTRVDSPGGDGDVTQSNTVASAALAANLNLTKQDADQRQRDSRDKCCPEVSIQALGQKADSSQAAFAFSLALQAGGKDKCGCPSAGNSNAPVRVHSSGGGGDVTQTNGVWSAAKAANLNATLQEADQDQAGGGIAIQALGQAARSHQLSAGQSLAAQLAPKAHGRRLH